MKRTLRFQVGRVNLATIALVMLASCSGGTSTDSTTATTTSSPFAVREVPSGYKFVAAGVGAPFQNWGSDSQGTDEPFTVLSPNGRATGPGVVVVSVTGFAGYEGLLAQASLGYNRPGLVHFKVGDRDAVYAPPSTTGDLRHGADLVVARGEDLAVRVTKATATRDELVAIEKLVVLPADHGTAPSVPTLPKGLELVGHVDAAASIAMSVPVDKDPVNVPASNRSHGISWTNGDSTVTVMTLPGTAADVAAFAARKQLSPRRHATTRVVDVNGRPGVLYLEANPSGKLRPMMLMTTTTWGDVLTVTTIAQCCTKPPGVSLDEQALKSMAASVEKISASKWKKLEGS